MTAADDLGYEPDLDDPAPDPADDKARKQAEFAKRQQAREQEKAELADLRDFKAKAERRDALGEARKELNAEGPIDTFLSHYDGDPTPDAIREAVAKSDFAALITFPPDPRDEAARIQGDNARAMAGGKPTSGQITAKDVNDWPLDRKQQFRRDHRQAWDTLMTGTPVAAPAGWA